MDVNELMGMAGGFLFIFAFALQEPIENWLTERQKKAQKKKDVNEIFKTYKHRKKDDDDE